MANLRPTFHESWYRVANLRCKLRPSAQISRQHYRGERWYVVRDPAGNQYHRLSAAAYRFVGLLDGSRTVAEAWELAGGVLADDAPTQPEVVQILSQLHAANLLEADITPDSGVLLRRHKQMQKRRIQGRLMNFLFPRIPLWDLDRFLLRWMPIMRLFLSKFGTMLWLGVIIAAIAAIAPHWDKLSKGAENAMQPGNWPFLWATFVLIKLIHELGHAFTCRRFGGEVHELGIMFLVFVPAPYVDASSAWSLPSKWQRILVGAGGMIFELFVAAICAFVWLQTNPNTLVNQLAYNTMLIASVSTVIFNANPLLRYDGYYMLSDWLEIPNLRQKSMDYSLGLIKRHVFRVKSPNPLPPVGQRFWLFFYAITSGIYRVFVGIMIILVVSNQVPVLGILMALGGVVTWLFVPVYKISKYLLLEPELHRKRPRAVAFSLAVAAALVVLVGLIRFPMRFEATGITEPEQKVTLRVRTSGFVEKVLVKDGQFVRAGQELLVCEDKPLATEIVKLKAEIEMIKARRLQNIVQSQSDKLLEEIELRRANARLDLLGRQYEELTLRAPFDGHVIAPLIHELQGKYIKLGDEVATVMRADPLVIKAIVPQADAALLFMEEAMWNPVTTLAAAWSAGPTDVESFLDKAGIAAEEHPKQRKPGEPIQTIVAKNCKLVMDRPADLTFGFDNGCLSRITVAFASAGAFNTLVSEHQAQLGKPQNAPSSRPAAPGQRFAQWLVEKDKAALDVEMVEQPGPKGPVTTATYRLLGRKVDVRLAGKRSENLTARVLTRVPAAISKLPHASLTFAGGGEHQNDPKDNEGTRVTQPQFEVLIRLDNASLAELPGQRAFVRFTMERDRPLIWQWGRKFWQLLQTQNAQNKWL